MREVGGRYRSAERLGGRQQILVALAILGSLCAGAGAHIEVEETGLHNEESVYGLHVPAIPSENWEDITLLAWGETNPDLYANVSFIAYGLYGEADLDNVGWITVTATGGEANSDSLGVSAVAQAVAFGAFATQGPIINDGWIDVVAFGGSASSTLNAPMQNASAVAVAYGLDAADGAIDNIGDVRVGAEGGLALADGDADAGAIAYGMVTENGGAYNDGDVMVTALGGTADAGNRAYTDASATGLSIDGDLSNTGYLDVAAGGGTATTNGFGNVAQAFAQSFAGGISAQGTVNNSGAISAVATGGIAEANKGISDYDDVASAYAIVDGIFAAGSVNNSGSIIADALGGTADANDSASATASARGIRASGPLDNHGNLTVVAAGGTAISWADTGSYADAEAEAWALSGYGGNLNNTGALTVAATGGTADGNESANAFARAYGIRGSGELYNGGTLNVSATGGTATTGPGIADANASAYGILAEGDVTNGGIVVVRATGGTANASLANARADAEGSAYGIYSGYGLIANSGRIDVRASGGTASSGATSLPEDTAASGWASAYGLYATDGAIDNAGDVIAAATGGSATGTATDSQHEVFATAWAYGLYLHDDIVYFYSDRHINNSGDLTVTATGGSAQGSVDEASAAVQAYGIESLGGAPIINSGRITVAATGGDALSTSNGLDEPVASASAEAYGIESDNADLNNSGAIITSATGGTATGQGAARASAFAEVTGLTASGDEMEFVKAEVRNTATITATATGGTASSASADALADASVYGLSTYHANVDNAGTISVTAQGGTALTAGQAMAVAAAYGLTASDGALSNSGDLTVRALGGTAEGDQAWVYTWAIGLTASRVGIDNSGTINVLAQAGDIPAGSSGIALAVAMGIVADHNNVTNSGDITVTARAGAIEVGDTAPAEAYGIRVHDANVTNSGAITVAAAAQEGQASSAYGIYMDGSGNLTNTGVIRATGDTAYELYVAAGTTTLADTYNVTLDGDPSQASIFVADGATLALNDATLAVTGVSNETLWNTPYRLFNTGSTGVVDGNFAEVRAANPNTTVTYYDQNSVGSADDTVALAYTPVAAPALASAAVEKQIISQAADVVNHHMTMVLLQNILYPPSCGLLADAGSTAEGLALAQGASGKPSGVFVEPYYSMVNHDADPLGYDARLWGFSAGYEHYLGNTLLGLHLGYGHSNIDFTGTGFSGNSEDQDVVTGGFSGLTRWDPWILHYGVTGFYGCHDYEGLTGLALDEQETASYDSFGTATSLMAGYIFRWGPHVFLPEAGFNWLWVHRPRYTTEATDPGWDTTYSTLDDHDVYAAAALQWLSSFLYDDVRVTPSLALGVRQLLTDAEASVVQSVPGAAPVLVRSEQDRTALTLSGSLLLTRTPHALSLAYDGDYFPDVQSHSFWLRYSWLF